MKNQQRDLGFWKLWNLSFGFFGVQIAYALQSSQVSRIFSTIGADPHDLSYFWILPPLMGLIVQPLVGTASDRTWNRLGRRLPYLLVGAAVAIIVMCFLPNSGSLGLSISHAIIFGLIMLMLLDTSINMAMQPFKMLVGDMVNERQKGLAYSIQSFLCNAGSVVGYVAPFVLAWFLSNTAPAGEVPPTVTWAFYLGAFILLLCVVYTFVKVKEMPPAEYAAFHGMTVEKEKKASKENMFKLLVKAPKVFWTVGLVQFFCWAAFLYMWTYSTDAVASQAFDAPSTTVVTGVTIDGKAYNDNYFFADFGQTAEGDVKIPVIDHGVANEKIKELPAGVSLVMAHIAHLNSDGVWELEEVEILPAVADYSALQLNTKVVLDSSSKAYQDAGDWNGNLLAIQAIAAVLWAIVLAGVRRRKPAYSFSLLLGAAGFIMVYFIHNQYALGICYALMGCAWAAMLAMPFTILTNALKGGNIGTYLGLFNCTITVPQIVAALCGGAILSCFPAAGNGAPLTVGMLVVSGVLLVLGAAAVWIIKETYGSQSVEPLEAMTETQMATDADI